MKILKTLRTALSCTPYIYPIAFYSFIIRVLIALGSTTSCKEANPDAFGFTTHDTVIAIAFCISLYGTQLWLLLWLITLPIRDAHLSLKTRLVFYTGLGLLSFNWFIDPLSEWYLDWMLLLFSENHSDRNNPAVYIYTLYEKSLVAYCLFHYCCGIAAAPGKAYWPRATQSNGLG